ncbi:hypothetical protein CB1_001095022 [Camelus ferus]|nr:hypothetical protein CB1_001095022 [Camelus ferus]
MKSSDLDQDLFTDSYCKVCSAQLISESQRVAHYERRSEPITHRPLPLREKVVEDGGWGKIWTGQAVGLTFLSLRRRILEPPQVGAPRQVCDPRQVRYQRQVRATHSREREVFPGETDLSRNLSISSYTDMKHFCVCYSPSSELLRASLLLCCQDDEVPFATIT